ncbi:natural resistance-associated macrophage protein [Stereum hirsutum FP-91666 SS1]|uniref:natural resistance-associated macrophage protein n=1 Tax=Stereum hirsutum (strain FP-91666) TaxID=721885 RepID=UPI000440EEA8|nr:natural resistance-associated macrophage protein [Stereum hirsutum FP-91666 SS1]EIM92885.1 natural resistance-associated macrophage protein [Stereum hirsutum FP-91666 SS1]
MQTTFPQPALEPSFEGNHTGRRSIAKVLFDHVVNFTGVGLVCAVAYFDPGNWGVDLQAGSEFGYRLLFVVLLAGVFAVFLQVLASKLGVVTGLDLASHCRLLLHDRPNHTRLWRWLALYPLYALSEIAIVSTDLAELLGSAMALCMLFPKLPLWAGVVITSSDVLFILALGDPLRGRPARFFEAIIAGLVLAVLICMCIIISKVDVRWDDAFKGFVPSKYIFQHGGLYTSVGIIGATVMPHSLFIGSALATQDRMSSLQDLARWLMSRLRSAGPVNSEQYSSSHPKNHLERENNSFAFVRTHLYHGIADLVVSLMGFAVIINSLILILASAVFYYGSGELGDSASLFDAYDLLKELLGSGAATIFALALLCAGQGSSIIATVAGQTVSEGFIHWRISPVLRRLVTRLIGLVPSTIVAVAVGRPGINSLLVISQVILSIVLPFIVLPLLLLTSSKTVMRVRHPDADKSVMKDSSESSLQLDTDTVTSNLDVDVERAEMDGWIDMSNGVVVAGIGWAIWLLVLVANGYVLVVLMMGQES